MYTKSLVFQLQFPFHGGVILQYIYYCWFGNSMNIQVNVAQTVHNFTYVCVF
jgi:hypothetical protein